MLTIGSHLSVSAGFEAMGQDAIRIGANTLQFFTRNPRGSQAKDIDPADADAFLHLAARHGITAILGHAPYTLNAASSDPKIREFARIAMTDDLRRMEHFPGSFYNFHPGSHTGQGPDAGIACITELLNSLLQPDQTTTILLETMAGKGSEIGSTFHELYKILDGLRHPEKAGICLDTCHVHDAGYPIADDPDSVLAEFDREIGLTYLKAIHLNDSQNPAGSRKDRHAKIGEGTLGLPAIERLINHPRLRSLPFYLETPNDLDGYAAEIRQLRSLYRETPPAGSVTP